MTIEVKIEKLIELLIKQLNTFFEVNEKEKVLINNTLNKVLDKVNFNFIHSLNKYYTREDEKKIKVVYFSPFHSAQYSIYLYYFSHIIASTDNILADKIYYLNKVMNACDLFHQVKLPDIFFCDHPVGSVMGRAKYGDFFSFSQNCTVGNNKGVYPIIGERVRMTANSSIIGDCKIGNNVTLGAGCLIKDQDIPDNSLVFGQSPNLVIKNNKQ